MTDAKKKEKIGSMAYAMEKAKQKQINENFEKLKEAQKKFQKDPILYFDKVLGVEAIEDYQRKVIKAIATLAKIDEMPKEEK